MHHYGMWPKGEIDHINGNFLDNRLANLRDVSASFNQHNRRSPQRNNKSGFLGVSVRKATGNFVAQIKANGKQRKIGEFKTAEEAAAAYLAAKKALHGGFVE